MSRASGKPESFALSAIPARHVPAQAGSRNSARNAAARSARASRLDRLEHRHSGKFAGFLLLRGKLASWSSWKYPCWRSWNQRMRVSHRPRSRQSPRRLRLPRRLPVLFVILCVFRPGLLPEFPDALTERATDGWQTANAENDDHDNQDDYPFKRAYATYERQDLLLSLPNLEKP